MESTLKIRPAEAPPSKARVSFRLPEPTIATLDVYLEAFQKIYGSKPDRDLVVDEILTGFFTSDREFLNYVRRTNGETGLVVTGTGKQVALKFTPQQPPAKPTKAGAQAQNP